MEPHTVEEGNFEREVVVLFLLFGWNWQYYNNACEYPAAVGNVPAPQFRLKRESDEVKDSRVRWKRFFLLALSSDQQINKHNSAITHTVWQNCTQLHTKENIWGDKTNHVRHNCKDCSHKTTNTFHHLTAHCPDPLWVREMLRVASCSVSRFPKPAFLKTVLQDNAWTQEHIYEHQRDTAVIMIVDRWDMS